MKELQCIQLYWEPCLYMMSTSDSEVHRLTLQKEMLCTIIKHGLSHISKYFCFYSSSNSMPAMTKKDYLLIKFFKMGVKQLN